MFELFFALSSGVFGSSFATFWIFVHEYRKERQELLRSIFKEVVSIIEHNTLPYLAIGGFYEPGMKEFMKTRYYVAPASASEVADRDRDYPKHCVNLQRGCRIGASQWRFYYGQKESHTGRKRPPR